jgi:hypothetical protein
MTDPALAERISDLAASARRDREAFEPPDDPPDDERAMTYLREGFGQAVWCYVDARTNGFDHIDPADFSALEDAMNRWLELYARCYGREIDADVPIRQAAELLLETHNVADTAQVLTHVPGRSDSTTT